MPTSAQKKFVIANLTTIAKENKDHHMEVVGRRSAGLAPLDSHRVEVAAS